MRITGIDIYASESSEPIGFSLQELDPTAPYVIRSIVGLDAEDIVPKFYGFGAFSKPKFYDFVLKPRDIVSRIVLNPRFRLDESFSDVRDNLYRAISATRTGELSLYFKAGSTIVAKITGRITKFEASYFDSIPEVQLTISCPDPMFRSFVAIITEPEDLPTENPVIITDALSNAPHGFAMQFTITDDIPSFTIQDDPSNPEWMFKITPTTGFQTDDVLYISSDSINKTVYIVRDSDVIFLMDVVEPTSVWPILFPGENTFYFMDIDSFDWISTESSAAYWGV